MAITKTLVPQLLLALCAVAVGDAAVVGAGAITLDDEKLNVKLPTNGSSPSASKV